VHSAPTGRVYFFLHQLVNKVTTALSNLKLKYRVSIKSFPDYKHLLQENYVEYKHIFLSVTQLKKVFLQLT